MRLFLDQQFIGITVVGCSYGSANAVGLLRVSSSSSRLGLDELIPTYGEGWIADTRSL